jgi:twitching motility protein PilT
MHEETYPKEESRIGSRFVKAGLITDEQLAIALKRQGQTGDKLGSTLLQLGYITIEKLLEFLKEFYKTPSIDMFTIVIEPSVLQATSIDQMARLKSVPLTVSKRLIFVAMSDPNDVDAINELEFTLGMKIQPIAAPNTQINAFLAYMNHDSKRLDFPISGADVAKEHSASACEETVIGIDQLLTLLVQRKASDLLVSAGLPPCLKLNNEVVRLSLPHFSPTAVEEIARGMMSEFQWNEFVENGESDFGLLKPDIGRFRVNVYRQRSSISLAIRGIAVQIPTLASLGFSPDIEQYLMQPQGLILVTGPTGHGKSTTVAAMVDCINSKRKCNIITLEDPIEYLHKHKMSNINQREIGRDTHSFKEGLKHIFRQAPDVIVIGEMRDPESCEIAVQAANTGHLVISTLHANATTSAVERVIEICPAERQDQIRNQLANGLLLCLSQRLIPARNKDGLVLAYEKMATSARIKNMIRENKCHQIRTVFQQSVDEYSSLDISLAMLAKTGSIHIEDALKFCENPTSLKFAAGH